MRNLPVKTLVMIFIIIFTVSIIIGWYVFSDPVDSPDVSLGDSENLESANRNASIPPWALKWAEGLQNVDAQERMRRLAKVRKASGNPRLDVQQRWDSRMQILAWNLIETLAQYETGEEYIREYIAQEECYMWYHNIIAMVTEEHIPLLCDMLNDESYAYCWHNIALTIGWVGRDKVATDALWNYFQQDDSWNFKSRNSLSSKIYSLALMGNIGTEEYEPILHQAVTPEGAEEFARHWIDDPRVLEYPGWQEEARELSLHVIRSRSLKGLIFSQKPDNIEFVRQMYEEEFEKCKANNQSTKLMNALSDCIAYQEYIEDHGKEQLLLELSLGPPYYFITEYSLRYGWPPLPPKGPDRKKVDNNCLELK